MMAESKTTQKDKATKRKVAKSKPKKPTKRTVAKSDEPKKADLVRAIILKNIKLVQNDQDDLVIGLIVNEVNYSKPSDSKRAYFQQKDKVLEQYRLQVAEEAMIITTNRDGEERKRIIERNGRVTHAEQVRQILRESLRHDTPLIEAVDDITILIEKRYREKGALHKHKPAYYRLQARNEIERLLPKVQSEMGLRVSTPQEIKVATRGRDFKRKTIV